MVVLDDRCRVEDERATVVDAAANAKPVAAA